MLVLIAILAGMVDPITLAFGGLSGWNFARSKPIGALIFAAGIAFMIGLQILMHRSFQDTFSANPILFETGSMAVWALIFYMISRARLKREA